MATTVIDLSNLDGINGFRLDRLAAHDSLGRSVSNAGDVNGDGFDDLVVGVRFADANGFNAGSSYVVFGKASSFEATIDLSDLDGSKGFRLDGEEGDSSGSSVSNAGDVNGDGFDDLIIGAPWAYANGNWSAGSSYVVFGKATDFDATLDLASLDGNNGFHLDGVSGGDLSGSSVSSAGDVNGDGFDDLIVEASLAGLNGLPNAGSSYVVFGKASGFEATMDLSDLDGSNGFRLDREDEKDYSDHSVSDAGDVNGDGFDDLIVGASDADPNDLDDAGSSYVMFGKAFSFEATMDLSDLDGSNGFRLDGEDEKDYSGHSVSNAGDINGDGFDDLIVGAPSSNPNDSDHAGSSYVVFGKDSDFDATLDLSSLDGTNGFRLDGEEGDSSGSSVSSAGDVNGDGFDDLIIGAPSDQFGGNYSGSSYVVFGKASSFEATIDLSDLDGSKGFRLDGEESDSSGSSVSSAGDVNGDGFDDLIVGAPLADPNGLPNAGSSYVVFGRSDFTGVNVIEGTPKNDVLKIIPAADIFEAGSGNDSMFGYGGADLFHAGIGNVNGGAGDDTFDGDNGHDKLTDGTGNDIFKFTIEGQTNQINGYNVANDTIQLENAVFTGLTTTGTLAANQFRVDSQAADANDFIIYNKTAGTLLYDADGSGTTAATQVATLSAELSLTNTDIVVI